ncbi:MAG TPA: hypothetical protein VGY66_05985 [Gemmataceae bacterium]|jgi:hypothetical protein|nr:hypothetical protein [Gemmataceae bacterium]
MHILRVATVYDPDVRELPRELRSALTKQDVKAIRTGPEFFAGLADRAKAKWLRRVLRECAGSLFELQFCASDDGPYRPYYRFYWGGEPAISLPRQGRLRAGMPAFLRHVYGVIGAFRENAFDMAGGLLPEDELVPISETGMWVEPGGPIEPEAAIRFLETFSGSQLCFLPDGTGAWLEEGGQFRQVKSLEREVARYFEALLKGSRI